MGVASEDIIRRFDLERSERREPPSPYSRKAMPLDKHKRFLATAAVA